MTRILPNLAMVLAWTVDAASANTNTIALLRGNHNTNYQSQRNLFPHRKKHKRTSGQSSWQGCLGMSDDDLSSNWNFPGNTPSCSWVHSSGGGSGGSSGGGSSSGGSGSGGSGGSGGGGSSGGGSSGGGSSGGGSGGGGSGGGGGYGDDDGSSGNGGGQGNYDDDNGKNGNGAYGDDDAVVVSNEDVYGGNGDYDPIEDFNIEQCETYENLWQWDLALSCSSIQNISSANGCNCTFAEELFDSGLLSCRDISLCPAGCTVCSTCLEIIGCNPKPLFPKIAQYIEEPWMYYLIAAAVALLVFALIAHYSRRKWNEKSDLNQQLIDKNAPPMATENDPTMMYLQGSDLEWKPLPSDMDHASSVSNQQLQTTFSMSSTASTGNCNRENDATIPDGTCTDLPVDEPGPPSSDCDEEIIPNNSCDDEALPDTTELPPVVDTSDTTDDADGSMGVSPVSTVEDAPDDEKGQFDEPVVESRSPAAPGGAVVVVSRRRIN